jgi:hypothetical protein
MTPLRLDLTDHAMLERAEELVPAGDVAFETVAD